MSVPASLPVLAIDAGNTRVKFGLFEPSPTSALPVCLWHGFVMCGQSLGHALNSQVTAPRAKSFVLSGSNPPEIRRLAAEWPALWPELTVFEDRSRLPLVVDVDFPEKVGFDRLLNSVAALKLREPDQAVVVVDSGTATTVDYVDRSGTFRGGAILPGLGMGARALHQYTALLPLIAAPDITASTPAPIGRNTSAAIRSGLFWGHVGGVRELIDRMSSVDGGEHRPLLVLTGGAAGALAPFLPPARLEPHLPLQGLVLASQTT
jgi:type III pantothenate kinase